MNEAHLNRALKLFTQLYPMGLEENEIWSRAGGDLALVNFSGNAKAQWTRATRLLKNGGGGNITFLSLLEEMQEDYPGNASLSQIIASLGSRAEAEVEQPRSSIHLPPLTQAKKHIEKAQLPDAIDDIRIHLQHATLDPADKREIDNLLTLKMGQWHDLKGKHRKGLMQEKEFGLVKTRLTYALLEIITDLESGWQGE